MSGSCGERDEKKITLCTGLFRFITSRTRENVTNLSFYIHRVIYYKIHVGTHFVLQMHLKALDSFYNKGLRIILKLLPLSKGPWRVRGLRVCALACARARELKLGGKRVRAWSSCVDVWMAFGGHLIAEEKDEHDNLHHSRRFW